MSTVGFALSIVLAVIGVILIVLVMLQSDRSAGLGAISASSSSEGSYWSKNKGNSMEGSLARLTKIFGAVFMILALIINFVA